jgi:TatD DNase family protein
LVFAKKLLELGCLISFSGIITFKKSSDLRSVVKYVPIEKMLIETDSPYLSPDPFRGKSNEPANVKIVAENVALIKDISFQRVANATTRNFKKLFLNE